MDRMEARTMSTLEIVGVIVSALAIWLTARRNMACWPVGLASVALYGWIFHDARLYSDMLLQGAFAVLQVYGWWRWHAQRHAAANPELAVIHRLPPRALLGGLAFAVAASAALGTLMGRYTDAALPFADATLTALSLVAQYWTARRYIASWPLWSAVNVAYVGMFLAKGLYPTAGLYALFIALAVIGWRDWKRAGNAAPVVAPLLPEATR
jgi:nicotinamide mononucleotide transporter